MFKYLLTNGKDTYYYKSLDNQKIKQIKELCKKDKTLIFYNLSKRPIPDYQLFPVNHLY